MGLLSGLKKSLKRVAKVAIKTAPLWSSVIPGGAIVGNVISRAGGFIDRARATVDKASAMRLGGVGAVSPGTPPFAHTAFRSAVMEGRHAVGGVVHAGMRGPAPVHYGAHHHSLVRSAAFGGAPRSPRRRAAARHRMGRRRGGYARGRRGGRNRMGRFTRRRAA